MGQPLSKVQELLLATLLELQESPDLTEADARWLERFALCLIVEIGALKEIKGETVSEQIPAAGTLS